MCECEPGEGKKGARVGVYTYITHVYKRGCVLVRMCGATGEGVA